MAKIRYTTTSFRESVVTEEVYNELKKQLDKNPNANLDSSSESFIDHFKGKFIGIGISFLIFIVLMSIFEKDGFHVPIAFISLLVCIFSILHLFLEAPSYATYIKKKQDYFSRLRYALQNTSSYKEFINIFYNDRLL